MHGAKTTLLEADLGQLAAHPDWEGMSRLALLAVEDVSSAGMTGVLTAPRRPLTIVSCSLQ